MLRMWQTTAANQAAQGHVLERLPRMEAPSPRTDKETKMKPDHPIARIIGTIIGYLFVALFIITTITLPVALIAAIIKFWELLFTIGI